MQKTRYVLALAIALAQGCASARSAELPALDHVDALAPRRALSPAARAALAERMQHHRDEMGALTLAVWSLDYERIARLADELAAKPPLAKPSELPDDLLLPQLPLGFFFYQRELEQSAAALAGAARTRDDARINDSFSAVARCCIGCHAAYLHEPSPPQEVPPQPADDVTLGDARGTPSPALAPARPHGSAW